MQRGTIGARLPLSVLPPQPGSRGSKPVTMAVQRRFLEYWGSSVTGRTQPYAQGDMLPRVDNTRHVVNRASSEAAALTGSHLNPAYDSSNIFSVAGFGAVERDHYQPLRGIALYKVESLPEAEGVAVAELLEFLRDGGMADMSLEELWWDRLLKDFPSLATPVTSAFRQEFVEFYAQVLRVAHSDAAVQKLAKPFVVKYMQQHYISIPMFWRIAEKLSDALEQASEFSRYHKRSSRVAVERVTKLMINTIAEEPWAHQDTTSPLQFDVSNFRAWHEAGYW